MRSTKQTAKRLTHLTVPRGLLWFLSVGWILGLALSAAAVLLAGTVVGIPAAFRSLNAIPPAAWHAKPTCEQTLPKWLSYC